MSIDALFEVVTLTEAVNQIERPEMRIFNTLFRGRVHAMDSDAISWDVITGSQRLLQSISVYAPATVTEKTGRKTITVTAPRLAAKRFVHTAELNRLRAYGSEQAVELMKQRIAREQYDMRREIDRTLEYWASTILQGKLVDADGTTLVDYGLTSAHKPTASPLWTDASADPLKDIRSWKRLIAKDAKVPITRYYAFVGYEVMDALLENAKVRDLLKQGRGVQLAEDGKIQRLAGVDMEEYLGTYVDQNGNEKYFVDSKHFCLVGIGPDVFDCPYAPVVDDDAPGGVGNPGPRQMYFSKSWQEKDPSGRWIKVEARPLPILKAPGAIVYAKAV